MPLTGRLAAVAAAVAATLIAASPALADPINSSAKPVTPASYDVVAIGGGPTQYLLDQLSFNYDTTHKIHTKNHPYIYSWDSTNPKTGAPNGDITTKQGCKKIVRPMSPNSGLGLLYTRKASCVDFAPADRSPISYDPPSMRYVALAEDNVTYATQRVSDAPHNLTTQDLREIYTCAVTNWDQFKGGRRGTIEPVLPETYGSGVTSMTSFLEAISVAVPGSCVAQPPGLPENVGTSKRLINQDAIVPYSTADFLAQRYHSAACGKKPTKGQNQFGCNVSGTLRLNSINGTSPTTGSGARTVLNLPAMVTKHGYTNAFVSTLFDVTRGVNGHIPAYLRGFLGPGGYFCARAGQKVIEDYGFELRPPGFPACGAITPG
jgi:hypothetical protein